MAMRRLPFADLRRVPGACSLALVASLVLLLLTPGLSAAEDGAPNAPYGVGAQFPSGQYGATQVPVTVTWHEPAIVVVLPTTYWVKATLAASAAWQSCYTPARDYQRPFFSCTFAGPFLTGQPYYIQVYAGILYPGQSGAMYGPPAELTYTPIAPPGPVRRTAAQPVSYSGIEASVAVSWIPPAYAGGGNIDEYRVGTLGPVTCSTTTLTCTLVPMGAGLSDKITVWAHSAGGWGAPNTFDYTVPKQATPTPTPTPKPVQPTPKPVQLGPTPTPVQPGRPSASSSKLPAEASHGTTGPAALSQTSSLTASAASVASRNPDSDRSTNPNAAGSVEGGGPPDWLLALLGAGLISLMIVAAAAGRKRLRPSSGQSQGGSEGQ